MRFVAVADRAKYVVAGHPRRRGVDPATGVVVPIPGLEARFFGHVFDSEKAQKDLGWTDDERKLVERYLLGHEDLDKHNGFYLEDQAYGKVPGKDRAVPAGVSSTRCTEFFQNEDGEYEQCPNESVEGTEFCAQHQMQESDEETAQEPANA